MAEELDRSSGELTQVFMRMAGLLFSEETLQTTLDLVCTLAHRTIDGNDGAGVTLSREGKLVTAAYSDGDVVERADSVQYELDEGPCLTAYRNKVTVRIDVMSEEKRWPRWAPRAAELGMSSSLSVPLVVRDESIGAMKLYSSNPHQFTERDETTLSMFTQQASVVLRNVLDYDAAQVLGDQLKEALETRDVIGMAKGILIAQETIDEEAAFNMLRKASQHKNIKLRELARELVTNTTRNAGS